MLLIEEYMNQGDLLAVLKDFRPMMPLELQLLLAWQVADGMNYLATDLYVVVVIIIVVVVVVVVIIILSSSDNVFIVILLLVM